MCQRKVTLKRCNAPASKPSQQLDLSLFKRTLYILHKHPLSLGATVFQETKAGKMCLLCLLSVLSPTSPEAKSTHEWREKKGNNTDRKKFL